MVSASKIVLNNNDIKLNYKLISKVNILLVLEQIEMSFMLQATDFNRIGSNCSTNQQANILS